MKISKLLAVAAISISALMPMASFAAQILSQSRSLQAIVDAVDYSPLSGDEVSDFKSAAGYGAFNSTATVTFPFNNNLASSTSTQNTQIDTTALRIYGTGTAATHTNTHFDNADISAGSFVNTQAHSGLNASFKLTNTGKVRLSVALETAIADLSASGVPVAEARIQTATGVAVWHQMISGTNKASYAGDVSLAAGSYLIYITAGANIDDGKSGDRLVDTSASFSIDATIIEDPGVPPRKKK